MPFVLDCSVTMAWIFPDEACEATDRLRSCLIDDQAYVPSLWPVEVANALLAATRRGRIHADEWMRIRSNLEILPIGVEPVSTPRMWEDVLELADKHNLSAYDASYFELALRRQLPLATLDRALITAARAAGLELSLDAGSSPVLHRAVAARALPASQES